MYCKRQKSIEILNLSKRRFPLSKIQINSDFFIVIFKLFPNQRTHQKQKTEIKCRINENSVADT